MMGRSSSLLDINPYLFRKAGGAMFDRASCLLLIRDKLKSLGICVVAVEGEFLELTIRESFLKFHLSVLRNKTIKKTALSLAQAAGLSVSKCILIRRSPR